MIIIKDYNAFKESLDELIQNSKHNSTDKIEAPMDPVMNGHQNKNINNNIDSKTPKVILYFFASETPETNNRSWCPDCVRAEPIIKRIFKNVLTLENNQFIFVHCPVGNKTEYRLNPGKNHPYRVHPEIQLKAVPTLVFWENNKSKKQLVEHDCNSEEKLRDFFGSS